MKLKALSHYDNDVDTKYGDCILLYDDTQIIVYDCGHIKHAEYVETFLNNSPSISYVYVVVSHNDRDHTGGICHFLDWLHEKGSYTVKVYTHQYLKHVDTILDKVDDGRKNRESLKKDLLDEFNNIKTIIETAERNGFACIEALRGVLVGTCSIVGPTVDEFTDVAAKAVDNRSSNKIGEGQAEETVMNAASVQLKCTFSNGKSILLCGDASPDYLKNLEDYDYIQLPHHGQEDDAEAIFKKLGGNAYLKKYLISDNTGSAERSGGSDDIIKQMKKERYELPYNTKNGIVELPKDSTVATVKSQERKCLGELDSI